MLQAIWWKSFPKRILVLIFVTVCLLQITTGCATSTIEPDKPVSIEVDESGTVYLHGRKMIMSKVPSTLKDKGATKHTLIIIIGLKNASLSTMKNLYKDLVSAGFPKVALRKPYRAIVEQ